LLKGTGAKDLEGRKQLETRSSGGECSQKGSLPILPAKDRACGYWRRKYRRQKHVSGDQQSVSHLLFEYRNWRKERKRIYETWSRNKVLTPRPLEGAPEIRIFGMKESSKGLLQKLRWDLQETKQVPKQRGSEWGMIRRKESDPNFYLPH
jgi:hypothetical protein